MTLFFFVLRYGFLEENVDMCFVCSYANIYLNMSVTVLPRLGRLKAIEARKKMICLNR